MKFKILIIVVIIVVVISGWWLSKQGERVEMNVVEVASDAEEFSVVEGVGGVVGQSLPDMELTDHDNNKVRLSSYLGKPLVVNSWAVWCSFCLKELNDFAVVQEEFADEVVIIAVNRGESLTKVKELSDEIDTNNGLDFLLDSEDSFYRLIGGFAMPETLFVDTDGRVRFHKRGPMDEAEIRQRIQHLISL